MAASFRGSCGTIVDVNVIKFALLRARFDRVSKSRRLESKRELPHQSTPKVTSAAQPLASQLVTLEEIREEREAEQHISKFPTAYIVWDASFC